MVVVMKQDATQSDIEAVSERVRGAGGEAFVSRGAVHTIVGLVGDTDRFQAIDWKQMHGAITSSGSARPTRWSRATSIPRPPRQVGTRPSVGRRSP